MKISVGMPLILAVLIVYLLNASYFTVDQRKVALLSQFGEVKRVVTEPGFHLRIPLVQTVLKFDARLMTVESGDQVITTQDQKAVRASAYAKWRIVDALAFYRAGQQLAGSDLLIKPLARVLGDQLSAHTLNQVLSGDQSLMATMKAEVSSQVKSLGVEIVDLRIKSVEVPKEGDFTDAVYERMRAEQMRIAAAVRAQGNEDAAKIRADADATAETVLADAYRQAEQSRGEGDAKATEIYASAYGQDPEFFAFYRSLNAYRDSFKDRQNILVVEPKGSFFKYFKDEEGAK